MDAAENDTALETPELDEDQLIIAHHMGSAELSFVEALDGQMLSLMVS